MAEPAYDAESGAGAGGLRAGASGAPHPRPLPGIALRVEGERVAVKIDGELDLECAEQLEHALRAALAAAVGAVELDLDGVTFCDCASLNVLLELRERGLRQGKPLVIRSAAPVVQRLLDLTGTAALFAGTDPDPHRDDDAPDPEPPEEGSREKELRVEVVQLRRAMQTRPVIDLARGILMASFALSAQDAWRVLVDASQHTNTKLHHLAHDLVGAVEGDPPPEAVRDQVAAAVARIRAASPAVEAGEAGERSDPVDG
ncbi:anti-sigma factor antagonist [Streptomyces bobili]|jgi:anti-anti-sigma factor|uniref:anti-sigma factor antagonist n=1 Tax=Streptomyces bobili TaxID=67280 RepID=UPI000A393221|nr:anti-sigma factor antagonist [Streptomyces bobili]